MGKKVEYTNGELTIVWQPEMCQHAGICVKMVQIENATTEELIAQISKCPSGALSYRLNKKDK